MIFFFFTVEGVCCAWGEGRVKEGRRIRRRKERKIDSEEVGGSLGKRGEEKGEVGIIREVKTYKQRN